MTGKELLREIERRDYYDEKFLEHIELVECTFIALQIGVIVWCLMSIAANLKELWQAF